MTKITPKSLREGYQPTAEELQEIAGELAKLEQIEGPNSIASFVSVGRGPSPEALDDVLAAAGRLSARQLAPKMEGITGPFTIRSTFVIGPDEPEMFD